MEYLAKTLYVGNLPWTTTEEELAEMFTKVVTVVSARVITDRYTGRSRGFGFVEVPDDQVQAAVDQLNGVEIEGRAIVVNEAREREQKRDWR